jgi:hypothetical protein
MKSFAGGFRRRIVMADRRDLDALFAGAREELAGQPSVVKDVGGRLARAKMEPRQRLWVGPAAAVLVGAAVGGMWMMRARTPAEAAPTVAASMMIDDLLITQRLACALDSRAVLVAWTTSAGLRGVKTPTRHHRYLEVPLRTAATEGGVFHCSLFIADEDVQPALVPPTIVAVLPGDRMIGFSASPTFVPTADVAAAVRSATPSHVRGVTVQEIDAALSAHAPAI